MKKELILILLITIFGELSHAQISISDIFGGKKTPSSEIEKNTKNNVEDRLNSSSLSDSLNSNYLIQISKMFDKYAYVTKHYYGLKKGKDIYGLNDQDYFGFNISMTFAINNRLVGLSDMEKPWIDDINLTDEYGDYTPVSRKIHIMRVSDIDRNITIDESEYSINKNDGLVEVKLEESIDEHLRSYRGSRKFGLMILYEWNPETSTISKNVFFTEPILISTGEIILKDITLFSDNTIGGIFLSPEFGNSDISFFASALFKDGNLIPIDKKKFSSMISKVVDNIEDGDSKSIQSKSSKKTLNKVKKLK